MEVYFEDGELADHLNLDDKCVLIVIDAKFGYSFCMNLINIAILRESDPLNMETVIYTNFLPALNIGERLWYSNKCSIFLRGTDLKFKNIEKIAEREIQPGSNIMQMYMDGIFTHCSNTIINSSVIGSIDVNSNISKKLT